MAISFVGASGQVVSTTSGQTIAGAWPSGYTAVADDVAFIVAAGKHNNGSSLAPSAPSGYTLLATGFSEGGTYDLQLTVFYKVLTAGEAAAAITVPAAYAGNSGGLSKVTLVYRGMNASALIDAAAVVSDSNFVAFSSFTPSGITTNSANAMVISFVATADDNALNLSPAQSFTLRVSGIDYDTTVGGDHSVGVADRIIASPSTPTMLGWNLSVNSPDYWSAITASFAEATSTVTRTATGSGTGTSTAAWASPKNRTASATGTGTSTAARLVTRSRTASGTGIGAATTITVRTSLRTATGTGTGSQTATGARALLRTATASGTGTSTAARLRTVPRTATAAGTGTANGTPVVTRSRTANGTGTGTATTTGVHTAPRSATGTGTGSSIATGVKVGTIARTATGSGAGTAIATTLFVKVRTATGSGTSSSVALGSKTAETQRQAAGSGTGSSTTTLFKILYRQGIGTGNGTATTISSSTERPYPPSAPRNQGKVKSRQTITVIAAKPVIHMALPPQRIQSIPQLVFDYLEDDEVMLCLA